MPSQHYDLHGVPVVIDCDDPWVGDVIASRLRFFSASAPLGKDAILVQLRGGGTPTLWPPRMDEQFREVLTHPRATAWWHAESDRLVVDALGRAGSVTRLQERRVEVWFDRHDADSARSATHPLLTLALSEILKRQNVFDVHASGVARDGQAVLFPGASGAGKTTLALALVAHGWALLSDDTVLLRDADSGVTLLPFVDEVDIPAQTAMLLPWLAPVVAEPIRRGATKWPLRLEELICVTVATDARPRLVLLPRRHGGLRSTVEPAPASVALEHLLHNVLLTEATSTQRHLTALSSLAALPTYFLHTGSRLDEAVTVVGDLLAQHAGPEA
jgi:hypothetical protein